MEKWWNLSREKLSIGRDEVCDIRIDDPQVSRLHAEIFHLDGHYIYLDKNSTNGSFINGSPVTRQILMPGDAIILGDERLIVMEGSDTSRIHWTEDETPQITAEINVQEISRKLSSESRLKTLPPRKKNKKSQAKGQIPETDQARMEKLLSHMQIIYELSRDFTRIMVRDDLYSLIEEHIYFMFPDVQRFCILLKSNRKNSKFKPEYLSSRESGGEKKFAISRSIFNTTVNRKVSILVKDAPNDERFQTSDSIIGLNLMSIMCAPLVSREKVTGAIYCDNREKSECFDNEDLELLTVLANHVSMALENARLYENIQRSYHESILALINAIEAKDHYTMGHTRRTSRYALGIAREMKLNDYQRLRIKTAAEVHDIGKIGVKEKIISKKSDLSNTEFTSVKQHVEMGEKILQPITYLRHILPIIRGHHEHFDGSGYPEGKKGREILLESRILAVADSFDAMTTQRPYNKPLSFSQALEECRKNSGSHFDPEVVKALERFIASNFEITDTPPLKKDNNKKNGLI